MNKIVLILFLIPLLGISCQSQQTSTACGYNGSRYEAGQTFPAIDECNTCTCGSDGQISCTEIACDAAIDECQTSQDCFDQGIDTSFCTNGEWSCVNSMCEFSCSIE